MTWCIWPSKSGNNSKGKAPVKLDQARGLLHHGIQGGKKILMFRLPKINLMF
ncbi:hypothetical protein PVK06_026478 [Gossypium arboreum]|uniref:Uncharacterized protein n=1 Tax=Gossypium arboreum TaxID=29729 RepID=A0ABR0NXT4_GOSAR|nr:hypothetical protein PVK06_026478 [Gossypium arboreum]